MIDIHTHILPFMDDGARDLDEAVKMLESFKLQQVYTAICTPHFDPTKISIEEFVAKREKALLALKGSKITLISGSETCFHDLLYQYSELDPLCISKTKYLLLELPYQSQWSKHDFECIEKLINLFRIIPIIAHIERYNYLWKSKKNIKELMNLGCVIQINAYTIIDKKQRRKALRYIKKGLIDVIGSDCHNTYKRPPNLKEAFDIIEKKLGSFYCDILHQNTKSIIKGRMIRNDTGRYMLKGSEL